MGFVRLRATRYGEILTPTGLSGTISPNANADPTALAIALPAMRFLEHLVPAEEEEGARA